MNNVTAIYQSFVVGEHYAKYNEMTVSNSL